MKKFLSLFLDLPFYFRFILVVTAVAAIGGKEFLGFHISGLTWFLPLVVSLCYLFPRLKRVTFPWRSWSPWILLLGFWLVVSDYPALHRTVQLMCPLVVGICVSSLPATQKTVSDFIRFCRYFAVLLGIICIGKSGFRLSGMIPYNPGLAAELMPGLLLSALFAASYCYGYGKDLRLWVFLCTLPVYGLFRSGIAVAGATLPFTFAPMGYAKRLLFLIAAVPVVIGIFYLPTVQEAMFYSGHGAVHDIFTQDFNTSGRSYMWEVVRAGIAHKPVWGHGTGACEDLILKLTQGGLRYPHNDWLLTAYDYGYFGAGLYAVTLVYALMHALLMVRKVKSKDEKMLFQAGAFSFVVLALIMLSDNIMVYASFFGNFQFMMLGLAYSAAGKRKKRRARPFVWSVAGPRIGRTSIGLSAAGPEQGNEDSARS